MDVVSYNNFVMFLTTFVNDFQIDSTIFVVFLTYFVIPLPLRIATGLSVALTFVHLIIVTAVPYSTPGKVLARQVYVTYCRQPFPSFQDKFSGFHLSESVDSGGKLPPTYEPPPP